MMKNFSNVLYIPDRSSETQFDGDVLNILYMVNQAFIEETNKVFNPRNAMYICRNDGKLNADVIHNKDTLINLNTMLQLARGNYSKSQLEQIMRLQQAV